MGVDEEMLQIAKCAYTSGLLADASGLAHSANALIRVQLDEDADLAHIGEQDFHSVIFIWRIPSTSGVTRC